MSNPKIRFSKQYPDWKFYQIKDIVEVNPYTAELPERFVYIDLESVDRGNLTATNIIDRRDAPSRAQRLIEKDDVLFQLVRPYQQNNLIYSGLCQLPAVASTGYAQLRPTNTVTCPSFLYTAVHTKTFLENVLCRCTGGTYPAINTSDLSEISLSMPCLEEQQKIAEFFTALDEKIRLENQKLIRFHELKKKLLVNVFSYEDYCETGFFDVVPSLMDYRGKTPLKLGMSWSDVETPYLALSALNVKDHGIDHSKEAHYGTKDLYSKWMKDKPLRANQILMTTEAPAGVVMQVPDERPYILSQRVIALDVDPAKVDECFFAYLLRSPFVQRQIERLCSGGTAKGISQKHLRELKVRYPKSIKTQQRIADLFSNIDSRISICSNKIESLEKLKKAFMQRMFV